MKGISFAIGMAKNREGKTARSCRLVTQPPIDIGAVMALVCGLPTAIKGRAERQA